MKDIVWGRFMSKDNSDFFKVKKDWSKTKDDLLVCYLSPYFAKIFHTRHPVLYIDCFAGKGLFEDGSHGSPIIALNIFKKAIENTNYRNVTVKFVFIEPIYNNELLKNLDVCIESTIHDVSVVPGKYEENIQDILQKKEGYNIFLYLDPFGIKPLYFDIFEEISKKEFYSLELLINFNTFGFIRAACSVMNTKFNLTGLEDVLGPETEIEENNETLSSTLTKISGGDYWKHIIRQNIKNGEIDVYNAENQYSIEYCKRLSQHFKYVINMPLRLKGGQQPKYRLIHATNHADGCIIMNDNMYKRKEIFQKQKALFPVDINDNAVDYENVKTDLFKIIKLTDNGIEIKQLYAEFISTRGVICSTQAMRNQLIELENEKKIDVIRNPEFTEKGKPSKFWESGKGKTITLR